MPAPLVSSPVGTFYLKRRHHLFCLLLSPDNKIRAFPCSLSRVSRISCGTFIRNSKPGSRRAQRRRASKCSNYTSTTRYIPLAPLVPFPRGSISIPPAEHLHAFVWSRGHARNATQSEVKEEEEEEGDESTTTTTTTS